MRSPTVFFPFAFKCKYHYFFFAIICDKHGYLLCSVYVLFLANSYSETKKRETEKARKGVAEASNENILEQI